MEVSTMTSVCLRRKYQKSRFFFIAAMREQEHSLEAIHFRTIQAIKCLRMPYSIDRLSSFYDRFDILQLVTLRSAIMRVSTILSLLAITLPSPCTSLPTRQLTIQEIKIGASIQSRYVETITSLDLLANNDQL
jgi:hypothetical protein